MLTINKNVVSRFVNQETPTALPATDTDHQGGRVLETGEFDMCRSRSHTDSCFHLPRSVAFCVPSPSGLAVQNRIPIRFRTGMYDMRYHSAEPLIPVDTRM